LISLEVKTERINRLLKKVSIILLSLYLLLIIGFYFFQEWVIFRPKKLTKDHVYIFNKEFEEINLPTKDNSIINALHFKVEDPKGVILYFHGNKGNLERWGQMVLPFTKYEYDVFIIDYRGYGKNSDKRIETDMYKDAQLSYDYIKQVFSEDKITIYGRSLGCTFATKVAGDNHPKQLILEAPFFNLTDLSRSKFRFIPYEQLLRFKFRSNEYIPSVTCPITIFHGNKDDLIPMSSGKKLYEVSNKKNTDFVVIDQGTHHNLMEFDLYKDKVKVLLD
jgi:alpha-beta hydrolase superfamily lysophospholipase